MIKNMKDLIKNQPYSIDKLQSRYKAILLSILFVHGSIGISLMDLVSALKNSTVNSYSSYKMHFTSSMMEIVVGISSS